MVSRALSLFRGEFVPSTIPVAMFVFSLHWVIVWLWIESEFRATKGRSRFLARSLSYFSVGRAIALPIVGMLLGTLFRDELAQLYAVIAVASLVLCGLGDSYLAWRASPTRRVLGATIVYSIPVLLLSLGLCVGVGSSYVSLFGWADWIN